MAIHVLDLEFGHLVSSDLYTYRMPSEEKKAEYAATKKAKRHLAKWEADPKTQALQAELRGVRATERFNRAAMHFEDIYSEWLRHLSREHDKRLAPGAVNPGQTGSTDPTKARAGGSRIVY